ncbi:MAG: amidohydrolase family protein [Deferrisomatales bacterium]|nr:amidohydrolase family protein [Deferrisomatales bacterium]
MFTFDCESHLVPPADDINYFPMYKMNQQLLRNMMYRLAPMSRFGLNDVIPFKEMWPARKRPPAHDPEESADIMVAKMDEVGMSMSVMLPEPFLPMFMGVRMMSTNGWLAKAVARHPDRLVGVCNVGPMLYRGVKNAIWELEYLVKELNFKAVKFLPPDDTYINNRELWPYYEKIQELEVPLFLHTGFSWCVPGRSAYCEPNLIEDVCEDFPDLTILAYHMGYPHCDALNAQAMKFPNLYIGTSLLPLFGHGVSKRAQKYFGEARIWAGIDKLVWGTDLGPCSDEMDFVNKFQISEQVQEEYGYEPLSDEDRAKWAGLNLAKILKITPPEA